MTQIIRLDSWLMQEIVKHDHCPLCDSSDKNQLETDYWRCTCCQLVWKDPSQYIDDESARSRYLTHNNHIDSPGYVQFLSAMIEAVRTYPWINPSSLKGLDYGCGPTNVMSQLLLKHSFLVDDYDPIFFNQTLAKQYDFIICHEVCEHFQNPNHDFMAIKELLKPNGVLFLRTRLYQPNQVFSQWSYARDKTHICFYNETTINWLKSQFKNLVFVNG